MYISVLERVGEQNAERVSLSRSRTVGAESGDGGGWVDEKPVIDQRTILPSRSAFERMRSLWNVTLQAVNHGTKQLRSKRRASRQCTCVLGWLKNGDRRFVWVCRYPCSHREILEEPTGGMLELH